MKTLHVFNTYISPNAFDYVKNTLESTFISEGELVKKFEEKLSKQLNWINPVTVNSGTSALHLALILANIKEGDEVLVPAQTFVASALVVLYLKATPVFVDCQYETGNICPKDLERKITSKSKAVMPVHWGGYPCDMDEINKIAKHHNLFVIEDAAHALGAEYHDKAIGSISDFTCFSFQAIKHITTGDGGAICIKDDQIAKRALSQRWFGIDRANALPNYLGERIYNIKEPGFKYHLNDYCAALGLANLECFQSRLERRRKIAGIYREEFNKLDNLLLFNEQEDRKSSYWLFGMHVQKRESFIKYLKENGIVAHVIHQRIDRNECFGGLKDLPNQKRFDETQIHIPIHDGLTDEDVDKIVQTVKEWH